MILGFAHLAINAAKIADVEAIWETEGYSCFSRHLGVANYPLKRAFGDTFQAFHDLVLLKAPHLWPLELTCHGTTVGENTQLVWSRERIVAKVREPRALESLFVNILGFKLSDGGDLSLESRFPEWSCRIRVEEGDGEPVRIDASGPTCLAFYCNRIEEDTQRLMELGAVDCTGVFELTLGERAMSVAMMRLPGGPLLELINPRSRKL